MSRRIVRVALFILVAAVAVTTARRFSPFRSSGAELVADSVRALEARTRRDTLKDGETLDILLRRSGLDGVSARQVLAATPMIDPRRVRPGMPVEFIADSAGGATTAILFKLAIDRRVRASRVDSLSWTAREETLPWTTDTIVVRGAVVNNLYDALHGEADQLFPGGSHNGLVFAIADVYKFRVDMSRELRRGDSVHAVIERARGPEAATRVSRVLATRLYVGARPIEAFHFESPASSNVYYDAAGKSLATAFLRSPIEFARVTSSFGMRFHPILRIRRAHEGVDYGASQGTPVQSIGDGTVVRAGDAGGYGNVIEVRHPNGYVSRYAHLSRFSAKGQRGNRVNQGDVVGYVGRTGLATAAHLHFEILVGGNQMSPSLALRNVDGTPLPAGVKPAFDRARDGLLVLLGRAPGVVRAVTTE